MTSKMLRALLLSVVMLLVASGSALAKHHPKLTAHAPSPTPHSGQTYTVTVTGHATSKANFVVAWITSGGACKSNYGAEYAALGSPTTAPIARSVSGNFTATGTGTASSAGARMLCAYLINHKSTKTYKHSSASWTNLA